MAQEGTTQEAEQNAAPTAGTGAPVARESSKKKRSTSKVRLPGSRKQWIFGVSAVLSLALAFPLVPEVFRQARFLLGVTTKAAAGERSPASEQRSTVWKAIYLESIEQTLGTMTEKWRSVQQAELRNTWLELENANLKVELEKSRYACKTNLSKRVTDKGRARTRLETGSLVGRTLASIDFVPPAALSPAQLYVVGLAHMRAREDEKAAYILTQLVEMTDIDTFKTAQNYLLTGVLWYRLKNLKLADQYFNQALRLPENKDSIAFQARARLWKAVVAKAIGQPAKSQYWLTELVDHNPHSMEAEWVNPQFTKGGQDERAPASH